MLAMRCEVAEKDGLVCTALRALVAVAWLGFVAVFLVGLVHVFPLGGLVDGVLGLTGGHIGVIPALGGGHIVVPSGLAYATNPVEHPVVRGGLDPGVAGAATGIPVVESVVLGVDALLVGYAKKYTAPGLKSQVLTKLAKRNLVSEAHICLQPWSFSVSTLTKFPTRSRALFAIVTPTSSPI